MYEVYIYVLCLLIPPTQITLQLWMIAWTLHNVYWSFQNVFEMDFMHFQSSNTLWKGAQIHVSYHIKVKDLLDICQWGCNPSFVSLLTDRRLKGLSNADFFKKHFFKTFFQQRAFLSLCVMRCIRRCTQKLGHDILGCFSKFRRSARDNWFLLPKNHRENILKRTIQLFENLSSVSNHQAKSPWLYVFEVM